MNFETVNLTDFRLVSVCIERNLLTQILDRISTLSEGVNKTKESMHNVKRKFNRTYA